MSDGSFSPPRVNSQFIPRRLWLPLFIARNQIGQFPALRTLAYLNLAIHDAIVGARQKNLPPDGAVAGAAAMVLAHLFPKDEQ